MKIGMRMMRGEERGDDCEQIQNEREREIGEEGLGVNCT
jgi:hypothetical protein